MNQSEMLDTRGAAEFLHVRPRTLEAWRARGIGPRFVALSPRSVRYSTEDLRAFLAQCTVEPGLRVANG